MAKKTRPKRTSMAVPKKEAAGRPNWFVHHPVLTALGIFSLLAIIFYFDVLLGGKTYLAPDAQTAAAMTAPLDKVFWETWRLPLWSPHIFCGMPSFASLMYVPFVYMPGTLLLPLSKLVSLPAMFSPALHYIFAAMGVFLFLRRKDASFLPALFGGLAFMFTPYLITMQVFGHGSQMMTSAYIPWALWAVDRLIEKFSWRHLGLAGLILGFQLQRGHVQISYYILMLAAFYVLCHLIWVIWQKDFKRLVPILGGFMGALVIAGGLAAMLYLPLQEYTPYSIRGTSSVLQAPTGTKDSGVGFEYATQWSFSPGEMMTFIIPSFYGFGGQTYWGNMPFTDYPNYMGILVLGLAIAAFVLYLPGGGPNRFTVIFFGLAILFSLLLSFGHHFASFYKFFYNYLPYFNKFRVPVMILILVQCSVAILAGLGMEAILTRLSRSAGVDAKDEIGSRVGERLDRARRGLTSSRKRTAQRLWTALIAVVAVTVLLSLARDSFFEFMRGVYPDQYEEGIQRELDAMRFRLFFGDIWIVTIFVAGGLAMLALALSQKISGKTAAAALCLFTLVDLWVVGKKLGETYPQQQLSAFLEPDEITRFLKSDSPGLPGASGRAGTVFRIYPTGRLFGDVRWPGQGFESVGGYHAAKPRPYQDFIEATGLSTELPGHHIIDMLNAKYVLTFATLPDTEWVVRRQFQVGAGGGAPRVLSIYENPTVLQRAYLVGEYEVEADPVAALSRLVAGPRQPLAPQAPRGAGSGPDPRGQGFDPHRRVLLDEAPEIAPQPDSTAKAQLVLYDFHQVKITTQSAHPQMLVLSDNYYPVGWQAYVDSQPVKTHRANYCFRAVCVPAGTHQVEFRFHSASFTIGLWTSIAALIVAMTLIFVERKKPALAPTVASKVPVPGP